MRKIKTTRRSLLQGASAAGLGFALVGCEKHDPFAPHKPPVPGSAGWATGEERSIATSCGQCNAGCGVRLRVVEGRAVKVAGNTACPINRGGVGPRGLASVQGLYDPDRITGPLQLVGQRGSGEWREIEWDAALALLAERLAPLREAGTPERLGIFSGHERGFMLEFWKRFATSFGTPNRFDFRGMLDGAQRTAMRAMQGQHELPAYDWQQTRLVLSLGSGVLDASCQMLHFASARSRHVQGAERARIVHVGPALTRTAMNADDYINARVGTNAAFALGIAHVLVRDGLHDAEFVAEHCQGFDSWEDPEGRKHDGFAELLNEYTPERVGEICGVVPREIELVAARMAANRPCFAICGLDDMRASNGVQTAMAVHALNALLGAIERPGGLLVQQDPPLADWPEVEPDEIAEAGLERDALVPAGPRSPWDALPERFARSKDAGLDVALLHEANPLFERTDHDGWREFLAAIPFVVSFASGPDETNVDCADLILPDHHWLERWEDSCAAPSQGRAVFGLRQPVVDALHDTRHTGDALIATAKLLGEGVEEAFPWKSFATALKKRVVGLYKAKSGSIIESKGSKFLKRLYAEGYWYDDAYEYEQWDRSLLTDSGRFEFFPVVLMDELKERALAKGLSLAELATQRGFGEETDRLVLPDYQPLATSGDEGQFPLLLVPFRAATYLQHGNAGSPWLIELAPWKGRPIWATEVELHPTIASEHGIANGDVVRVASAQGAILARAHLSVGQRPEIVRIAQGAGHTAGNRYATGWGANVMRLVASDLLDPLGGSSPNQGTRVSIRKEEV